MSAIEAVYIFDEHNNLLLSHTYTGRPSPPSVLLPLYLQHAAPRSSVLYFPALNPSTVLYSIIQDNLLFFSPSSGTDTGEPLLVLEFLHRVADALEEFLGSPLLASKIAGNYDVVAQILAEIADAGVVCQGEANALRDVVETGPGVLNNLLGKVGLPGNASVPGLSGGGGGSLGIGGSGGLQRPGSGISSLQPAQTAQGSAIPWRRSNVRHTSNELYVDIVETLSVTLAPSGRPLAAFAYGSIAFTSKVSGVPDLLLSLSTGGKGAGMGHRGDQLRSVMERTVFHPCVRLARWKSEGVLSFVPPDGRFALCGYEVELLGADTPLTAGKNAYSSLGLPAGVEVTTGLGTSGNDFEVRLTQPTNAGGAGSAAAASLQSNLGGGGGLGSRPSSFRAGAAGSGDSKGPSLENLVVRVPLPTAVRNVTELRPSKGEAHWSPVDGCVEWKVAAKDFGPMGAVLRCTIQGPLAADSDDAGAVMNGLTATTYDYNDDEPSAYQASEKTEKHSNGVSVPVSREAKVAKSRELMPTSSTLSFGVKGWLASGLKVESLLLDNKKSRGLGQEVKPYKGVKYLTVSREGIEVRC
ncbi:hypothetical protein LTR56_019797 [Elasticomyces elasticus]|nr:hypothetical protein LTR56_019797 [Elasticomyces elasticus]KAK3633549.1 hypothetical protein LTR22_020061 [Elasticomyces elasticus]KAK4910763.1 hypothetical protein LTR49_020615 [Elasticomyces elasticus]KAK5762238.1 hypothetical protein LTS12_007581 [Elasticomyces elasticus]